MSRLGSENASKHTVQYPLCYSLLSKGPKFKIQKTVILIWVWNLISGRNGITQIESVKEQCAE